ncbi:hypothetical protein BESB_044950 [Besnoitia besnoiti]|uniref:Transmembrane protein n=1 Tax=Besnoitia besnoiti TaxID=94643 RepID=A0A2A9MKU1_BESBE|nr:hypothetical protein BESB_044950 [Besnoitia besnoiti]PFH36303.1 hypothetical protein BESB_044950 [Besnoitia besnoiti]
MKRRRRRVPFSSFSPVSRPSSSLPRCLSFGSISAAGLSPAHTRLERRLSASSSARRRHPFGFLVAAIVLLALGSARAPNPFPSLARPAALEAGCVVPAEAHDASASAAVPLQVRGRLRARAESELQGEGFHRVLATRVEISFLVSESAGPPPRGHDAPAPQGNAGLACRVECIYTLGKIVYVDPDQTWELGLETGSQGSRASRPCGAGASPPLSDACETAPRIATQVLDAFVDVEQPVFSPLLSASTTTRQRTLGSILLKKGTGANSLSAAASRSVGTAEARGGRGEGEPRPPGEETAGAAGRGGDAEAFHGAVTFRLPVHHRYDAPCAACTGLTRHRVSPPRVQVVCQTPPEGLAGEESGRGGERFDEGAEEKDKRDAEMMVCRENVCAAALSFHALPANAEEQGDASPLGAEEDRHAGPTGERRGAASSDDAFHFLYVDVPVGSLDNLAAVAWLTTISVVFFSVGTFFVLYLAESEEKSKSQAKIAGAKKARRAPLIQSDSETEGESAATVCGGRARGRTTRARGKRRLVRTLNELHDAKPGGTKACRLPRSEVSRFTETQAREAPF